MSSDPLRAAIHDLLAEAADFLEKA